MTSMVWDSSLEDSILAKYEDHTEFVLGQRQKERTDDTGRRTHTHSCELELTRSICIPLFVFFCALLFSSGVDFNLFHDHQIATTAWDETVRVFRYTPGWGKPQRPQPAGAPTA